MMDRGFCVKKKLILKFKHGVMKWDNVFQHFIINIFKHAAKLKEF